jgi:hypothetical protein
MTVMDEMMEHIISQTRMCRWAYLWDEQRNTRVRFACGCSGLSCGKSRGDARVRRRSRAVTRG